MNKPEILQKIEGSLAAGEAETRRNIMGTSEAFYDPYYLIGKCFPKSKLSAMLESELTYLVILADYSTKIFY